MQNALCWNRSRARLLAALLVFVCASPAGAQTMCSCAQSRPFGSCAVDALNDASQFGTYPDQFPGACAIVTTSAEERMAYVADYFSGRTFRYRIDTVVGRLAFADSIFSPGGSLTTTGLVERSSPKGSLLFWAIDGQLVRTDIDGGQVAEIGTIQVQDLAAFLRQEFPNAGFTTGSVGGITYHPRRDTFWGVDIINDVYFEFRDTGDLVFEAGRPVFFLNPERNPLTGGAYGNSITFLTSAGQDFFDIPVGSLSDGRPSRVARVHASPVTGPDGDRQIGDDTGIFYLLGPLLGNPRFVTGIAFWQDLCGVGQHAEIVPEVNYQGGDRAQVIAVSADDPTAASIADFRCEKTAPATVTLTWRKTTPYTRLEIKRTYLTTPGAGETPVLDLTNAATDPQSHEDTNLAPGSYEYVARVTAGARALPEIRCRVTLGRGEVLTFVRVSETTGSGGQEPVPFAVTVTDSQTVMVADLLTGDAETFDLDLNPTGSPIPGPFDTGLTTGLEFNPRDGKLYWLQNLAGRHVLQATSVTGAEEGNDPVSVDIPFNLVRGVSLGDLSYDAARDFFWTVDLLNEVIYAVRADGSVPESFRMAQIAVPEIGGLLSGGLAAAGGEGGVATLDLLFGARTARVVDTVSRFSVDLTTLQPVGAPQRVDLQSTIGVGDVGAVAGMAQEGEEFLYITARDSRAVYKLALGTPLPPGVLFRRGDANNDGRLNISDPSFILRFLFEAGGGPAPICADAADGNNDEAVDIGDAVFLFNYLFRRQGPPPPPFPGCGTDSETGLGCEAVSCAGA